MIKALLSCLKFIVDRGQHLVAPGKFGQGPGRLHVMYDDLYEPEDQWGKLDPFPLGSDPVLRHRLSVSSGHFFDNLVAPVVPVMYKDKRCMEPAEKFGQSTDQQ